MAPQVKGFKGTNLRTGLQALDGKKKIDKEGALPLGHENGETAQF